MDIPTLLVKIDQNPTLQKVRPSVKTRLASAYLSLLAAVEAEQAQPIAKFSNPKASRKLTRERLLQVLDFDPSSGEFIWKQTQKKGQIAGHVGTVRGKRYRRIRVDNELIMAHVLVWLVTYGDYPGHEIDHTNGNGVDNRPANLVKSSRTENNSNTSARVDAAEYRSVALNGRFWAAQPKYLHKTYYVSGFDTAYEASVAREFLEAVIPRGVSHGKITTEVTTEVVQ